MGSGIPVTYISRTSSRAPLTVLSQRIWGWAGGARLGGEGCPSVVGAGQGLAGAGGHVLPGEAVLLEQGGAGETKRV